MRGERSPVAITRQRAAQLVVSDARGDRAAALSARRQGLRAGRTGAPPDPACGCWANAHLADAALATVRAALEPAAFAAAFAAGQHLSLDEARATLGDAAATATTATQDGGPSDNGSSVRPTR